MEQKINFTGKKAKKSGVYLKWDNIRLQIKKKKGEYIEILKGMSGYAKPGQLYAIIGASGGGKTTLLSILTGRIRGIKSLSSNSECQGKVLLNNIQVDVSDDKELNYLSKNIAFVMQHDLLFATEKCGEAIAVSANLRLTDKKYANNEDKARFIDKILTDLDLQKCKDTYIGSEEIRGLSGGERTRTSIGTELITNPSIIVLDEPTRHANIY